jgi:peptide/nickel transport system permease protein
MIPIIRRRLLRAIPILIIVTFATSVMISFLPGNAAVAILGANATPQSVHKLTVQLGLNKPILARYFHWIWLALHGNLGTDLLRDLPISHEIANGLPVTAEIVILAELIALLIAIPTAIYAAYNAEGLFDRTSRAGMSVLLSVPTFIAGPLLATLFAVTFHVFPAIGWVPLSTNLFSNLHTAMLPAFALALPQAAVFNRVLRSDVVGIMDEDFIMFARAKNLSGTYIVLRHALRPASISLVTLIGLSVGTLLGGSLIVETLFSLPGLGQVIVQGVDARDVGVVQAGILVISVAYVVLNIVVDIAYGSIDPRARRT